MRYHRLLALSLVVILTALMPASAAAMPPRPPRPTPRPDTSFRPRTLIVLSLHLPAGTSPTVWPQVWTVVQWQDAGGAWHDVAGWRGALDEAAFGSGKKTWVVADKDLGTGPFAWRVYARPGGDLLTASPPFRLPSVSGDVLEIRITAAPK
jgi:hypothetical protein